MNNKQNFLESYSYGFISAEHGKMNNYLMLIIW